jgi:hypothetical protein
VKILASEIQPKRISKNDENEKGTRKKKEKKGREKTKYILAFQRWKKDILLVNWLSK